jgi:DNA-binding LacI/PurR family transcriptional regulator
MVEDIIAHINDGTLAVGQRLATESMLKEQYGISINSIKRGLGILVERGILSRKRGSGTFVASTDTTVQAAMVRRDTIAIIRNKEYWRYHPFFTEQHRGILAGLAGHGWKVFDLQLENEPRVPATERDSTHRDINPTLVNLELEKRPEVSGVIWVQGSEAAASAVATEDRTVIFSGPCETLPYVSYDWQRETERLFHIALEKGARRLGVIGVMHEDQIRTMLDRACRHAGIRQKDVALTLLPCPFSNEGAALTNNAYQTTLSAFGDTIDLDGLIITDDFTAQGVTDALASLPRERWQDLALVALLNRESKLRARIPMTALISDGYACGVALADLLNEQMVSGTCSRVEWR